MSENMNQWFRVPGGSTASVSVSSESGVNASFVTNGRVVPTVGDEEIWYDYELNPGPRVLLTKQDTSYSLRIFVKFFGEQEEQATVRASVFAPDGSPIPDWWGNPEFKHQVSGKAGDRPSRVTLLLIED